MSTFEIEKQIKLFGTRKLSISSRSRNDFLAALPADYVLRLRLHPRAEEPARKVADVLRLRSDRSVHQLVGCAARRRNFRPRKPSLHRLGLRDLHQRSALLLLAEHHVLRHLVDFQVFFSRSTFV